MITLDPDYLPRTGFWEGVANDLSSRGALAGALAAFYALTILAWWIGHVHFVRRRARRMSIRILVTGTRGKSSVVRLLHSALRQAGYRVWGKTTGTAARTLDVDGHESPTRRLGQVSILETLGSISAATHRDADALVTECMAVNPVLIEQLSADIVRPTIVDVTNAELDHLEEEGSDRRAIMRSLSLAVNGDQTVVTAEQDPMAVWDLQQRCHQAGAALITTSSAGSLDREGLPLVPDAYPDNVALALATTRACGIADDVAVAGMRAASREPQTEEVLDGSLAGMPVRYVNLGSINDADNVVPAVRRVMGPRIDGVPRIALLCGRSDRPLRALLFAGLVSPTMFDAVAISGGPEAMVRREMLESGWATDEVAVLGLRAYSVRMAGRRLKSLARAVQSECTGYELVALENVHVPLAVSLHRRFESGGAQ